MPLALDSVRIIDRTGGTVLHSALRKMAVRKAWGLTEIWGELR